MNEKNTKAKFKKPFKKWQPSSNANNQTGEQKRKPFRKFKKKDFNKKWDQSKSSNNRFEKTTGASSERKQYNNSDNNYRGEKKNNNSKRTFKKWNSNEENDEKREPRKFNDKRSFGKFNRSSSHNDNRSRGGFRGRAGKRGGQRQGGFRGQKINISAFINKPCETTIKEIEFKPEYKFSDFKIDGRIIQNLANRGYENPTPIQDKSIVHILDRKDIVGLANTGTGKTAAFLIPLIDKILKNQNNQILVLAPTRELALQIEKEFQIIATRLNLQSVVCVGGANIRPQIAKLRRHQHLIIGTPGRTIDLIKRNALRLEKVKTVVIDEADRMLDMGFLNDVRFILTKVSSERHTLCFSATMPPEIEKLIKDFLKNPISISVKTQDTSKNVHQDIIRIKGRDKKEVLYEMITEEEFKKVLIFGRTKRGVEKLSKSLNQSGIRTESIHGNKSHNQRQFALKKFTENRVSVLVATDVAARGLDIKDVSHVINYDIPATYDDYIHRIGRTGRANNLGKALTFVD